MNDMEVIITRKPYVKPGFVLETELETRAGTPNLLPPLDPNGVNPVDPTKLFLP